MEFKEKVRYNVLKSASCRVYYQHRLQAGSNTATTERGNDG